MQDDTFVHSYRAGERTAKDEEIQPCYERDKDWMNSDQEAFLQCSEIPNVVRLEY